MRRIPTFQVLPKIPEPLQFLEVLSFNLWWSWKRDAVELFRRMDPALWEASRRNPVMFLTQLDQKRLDHLATDDSFLAHLKMIYEDFYRRVISPRQVMDPYFKGNEVIAYFSMEFGIHESLPFFAGGLGVLAGDHLKSSSNISLPLVGIGLLYRRGYFRQYLNHEGWQQEDYPETDSFHIPMQRAHGIDGKPLRVAATGPLGEIYANVWKINIGRIPLYLLDTNTHENSPEAQNITDRLYTGNLIQRLSQEVILGIGGMRALKAMGYYPKVIHMNEGHCSFATLERISQTISKYNVDLKTALEIVPRSTIFTTHTPVAAGNDEFEVDLVMPVLNQYVKDFGVPAEEILSWGQYNKQNPRQPLSMFILGMHLSQYRNGVSKLHGNTARKMWTHVWPNRPVDEIPITHVTNGIHISSFISPEFSILFDRYLGPNWYMCSRINENVSRIDSISDEELWRAHELNRAKLINVCRQRLVNQYKRRNDPRSLIEEAETLLDNDILTIGFARRFASYKRAGLIFKDIDRLESILNCSDRPVQFIFAGKAHPMDNEGKGVIKYLIESIKRTAIKKRIVFLEDYDLNLARLLVQGSDVWLNNPRRPLEACGTSGMKAAINGILNVSILDGWWCEGYSENTGWAIGHGEEYSDLEYQDFIESRALYNILENDVIPAFYNRKNGDISYLWLKKMKASMKMAMENFCSLRMAGEYDKRFYSVAGKRHDEMTANNAEEAKRIAQRVKRYKSLWKYIKIEQPEKDKAGTLRVGETFNVKAKVFLGELLPDEVDVEIYYGSVKGVEELKSGDTKIMSVRENLGNGNYLYSCTMTCADPGRFAYTTRVIPQGDDRLKFTPNLITWADQGN